MNYEEKNIFNLKEINDLPKNVSKEIKINKRHDVARKLLSLFDIKKELSINEILVGLYRVYKIVKTRIWVSSTLYNLKRSNIIKNITNKTFGRIEE